MEIQSGQKHSVMCNKPEPVVYKDSVPACNHSNGQKNTQNNNFLPTSGNFLFLPIRRFPLQKLLK